MHLLDRSRYDLVGLSRQCEEHENFLFLPRIEIQSSSSNPIGYMVEATTTDVKASYQDTINCVWSSEGVCCNWLFLWFHYTRQQDVQMICIRQNHWLERAIDQAHYNL